jgi:hypothetical protein
MIHFHKLGEYGGFGIASNLQRAHQKDSPSVCGIPIVDVTSDLKKEQMVVPQNK